MLYIVLSFVALLFVVGGLLIRKYSVAQSDDRIGGNVALAFGLVALFCLYFGFSFKQVDAGFRGVESTFGSVSDYLLDSGLQMRAPWVKIDSIDVRTKNAERDVEAASKDLQIVNTRFALKYSPDVGRLTDLYQEVGPTHEQWESVVILPAISEITKAVIAMFTAEELVTQRDKVRQLIIDRVADRLTGRFVVDSVDIVNFDFSQSFNEAIEMKQVAEQQAQKARNDLNRIKVEAEQLVVRAEADKKQSILRAEAEAESIRVRAEADAKAFELVAKTVTRDVLLSRFLEKWDGKVPQVMGGDFQTLLNIQK